MQGRFRSVVSQGVVAPRTDRTGPRPFCVFLCVGALAPMYDCRCCSVLLSSPASPVAAERGLWPWAVLESSCTLHNAMHVRDAVWDHRDARRWSRSVLLGSGGCLAGATSAHHPPCAHQLQAPLHARPHGSLCAAVVGVGEGAAFRAGGRLGGSCRRDALHPRVRRAGGRVWAACGNSS